MLLSGSDRVLDATVGLLKEADKLKMTGKVSGHTKRKYQTELSKQNGRGQYRNTGYTNKRIRNISSGMLKARLHEDLMKFRVVCAECPD